ncbi:hypothetical protein OAL43_00990 [bacterium]|nr:hypothetical protein [bacterium]MDC0278759.1 hypothetical protein [bacterium]MDC0295417.1 hypothetical protein [bacterium]
MSKTNASFLVGCLATFCLTISIGCAGADDPIDAGAQQVSAENNEADDHSHDHGDHSHGDHDHDAADSKSIEKSLTGLSEEDRESVMSQKVCLVGGEPLGSMGAPEKVDVNGTPIWICCEGCRDTLLGDPEKFIAMIKVNAEASK